ncbi:ephrin type-A receptor 3-like isoform X2 [Stylophora pistillata]|uniref:ephrin type-A receptor 3-like isoform X2 n=1 Tax=Stylophora pistillata TaxID=50429 RepID=UPI000C052A14|nr:ephrin type-A receptor 3-like isoform X2 [Stylophora pistillata]
MDYFLVTIVTFLQILNFLSADKVVLQERPTWQKKWNDWRTSAGIGWRWAKVGIGTPQYTICYVSGQQPNAWLFSNPVTVSSTVTKVDITVLFNTRNCTVIGGDNFCKEYFDFYMHQSTTLTVPDPSRNNATYEKIAKVTAPILGIDMSATVTKNFGVKVKGKYIILAFHNQGSCSSIHFVSVSYYFCPELTIISDLMSLPRFTAPAINSETVEGSCVTNAVYYQGSLTVDCQSDGVWNISSVKGRCVCREDMENRGGECIVCPEGKYNDQNGFNCTVIPSGPQNIQAIFVNRSALALQWQPPTVTGDQTQVIYDLDCHRPCEGESDNKCVYKACGNNVIFTPRKDSLNITHVTIENLFPFINYTIKIYARNRVSDLAKRKYGIEANLTEITVRTNRSVPGKPEVFVEQPETVVFVSWTLTEKNGIIEEYFVTYVREDDLSETQTIATRKMEAHFELMAGKTYELQVFAINDFGRGPAGVKTFTLREEPNVTMYLKIIYGLVVLLALCILSFACYITYNRWNRRRNANRGNIPKTTKFSVMVYENVSMSSVAERKKVDEFRLDRDQITTVKVLGSGNFGQVSKAVYKPLKAEVAVKSLKDNAKKKDLQDMLTELDLMKTMRPHPHVVKLIGCCIEKDPPLIVLEYLPYGDLLGYLRKSRGIEDTYNTGEKRPSSTLTEKDLLSFAWMIADGMSYLSTMKIVHRDLAARNVLVGDNKVCKISDLGLARGLQGDIYTRKSQARLPAKWMPPESLLYGKSTTMSDIWSYGILMWEVFTIGESPYPGVKSREIAGLLQTGYRMPKPPHISQELYSIMTNCWEEQPKSRPTFPWLCSAIERLLNDFKTYVNLEVYEGHDYINFDVTDKE